MNAAAQQALLEALMHATPPASLRPAGAGLSLERGLAAYRDNLRALAARSLAAVFPQLAGQLGEADFAAMAWRFWRAHPPERGDLACWGDRLAAFLAEHAGEDSGLPGLAALAWALHQSERAADAALDAASLSLLASEPAHALGLKLRPGVALLGLHPAAMERLGIEPAAAAVLVWRESWRAQWMALDAGTAAFFDALLRGLDLQASLEQANVTATEAAQAKGIGASRDFDFSAWLQEALRHAWLHEVVRLPSPDRTAECMP